MIGHGSIAALSVDSKDKVERVDQRAIALGGVCEGACGPRGTSGSYAGYFRDLDGTSSTPSASTVVDPVVTRRRAAFIVLAL